MQYIDVLLSYTQSSDPEQLFELLDILGQGAYGSVSKALHKQTGQLYAIKILPATSISQISVIKKQIAILRQCNDQHIVKYFGSYYKDNNLWIVMEYCIAGSITDIVNITDKELNENQIASILQSVLEGLKYLHDRKKIHRDIKSANILLDQNGNAKLADFGVSTEMMYTNARHNTHIGSPYWMSPEVIKYSEYNQKTDIWSLGVTAIELAEGVVPYSHLKPFMAMWTMKDKPIQGFKQSEKWSLQFNDFIKQCLQINPDFRPQAQQLLRHDFIKKYSRGKSLLAELVKSSMPLIQNFRAGQVSKQQYCNHDFKQIIFNKSGSNNSDYETKTVIVKGTEKKSSSGVDSVIEQSNGNYDKFFKKNVQNYKKIVCQYEEGQEYGSVIIKDQNYQNEGHSRNDSQISVSSVVVKAAQQSEAFGNNNTKQTSNFFQNYVQNMQVIHFKQQQFKQSVQQCINQIEFNFLNNIQRQYTKVKSQLKQFCNGNSINKNYDCKQFNHQQSVQSKFSSSLFSSQSLLQYLYKNHTFQKERAKLQEEYKQQYLSNILPAQNNFSSMMIGSGNDQASESKTNHMHYLDSDDDNIFLKNSLEINQQCRKKSQSSADSPTSLFHNKKKNLKKLIIQETLQDPTESLILNKDTASANFEQKSYSRSHQRGIKQSNIYKSVQKTPILNQTSNNSKYKQFFLQSANMTAMNSNLLNSTGTYSHSATQNRPQKRVITTEPHEVYEFQNDSVSTLTKLNSRNLRQFYQDPVVLNNLKKFTQQSEEFMNKIQLNPFQLKKTSFSKEIKSAKSKEKQKDKLNGMRQKQRATHIAHIAMAHNRMINNSNKKLKVIKVIEEQQKSFEENIQFVKNTKTKKSKSKNKQTASTTIPFGSVGNMGALDLLPGKIGGKSKEKKASQIPIKTGPFSKIKNRS